MRYEAPETLDTAVGLLTGESGLVKVLAGGTDVLVQIHADMIEPDSNFIIRLRPVLVGLIIGMPITVYTRKLEEKTGVQTPWRVSLVLLAVLMGGFGLSFL